MNRRYVVADVFTTRAFCGNPVAVVLDAEGMTTGQMQQVAAELGYSETTFVLPPESPSHTARVRIFTPTREIPFAGHPNIGTAFVLAQDGALPTHLLFEEIAGLVPVTLIEEDGATVGAELIAPEALFRGSVVSRESVAACLSLEAGDICIDKHRPLVASAGLPFLVVELSSRDALRRCVPSLQGFRATLPLDGAVSIYAYTPDDAVTDRPAIQARMFTPRMTEDPATGSAAAALTALLAELRAIPTLLLTINQGIDMGRPSLINAEYDARGEQPVVRIGGRCVLVMSGELRLA
ncbi:PhzF family phenazine biosynthesis protein [Pluralibacter gergoviae]